MSKFIPGGPKRFDHQKRALKKVIQNKGTAALLMSPGTGKTAVAIDYASILALKKPKGEQARVLVIAPLAAVDSWVYQARTFVHPDVQFWAEALAGSRIQRAEALAARGGQTFATSPATGKPVRLRKGEFESAAHHKKSLALITSEKVNPMYGPAKLWRDNQLVIEVLNLDSFSGRGSLPGYRSKTIQDLMLTAVARFNPDLVIVDEAHKIKGGSSNTSRLLARLGEKVPRRMILTGTVMPHSPMDVYAQWRFLDPYAFGDRRAVPPKKATMGGFANQYAVYGGWMGQQVVGFKNLEKMENIMAERAIVVKKQDALDLPKTTDALVQVAFTPTESRHYEDMKKQLAAQLSTGQIAVTNRLTQMLRLRQITCGYLPDDTGALEVFGTSKLDTIKSLVQDTLSEESRVVVFAYFKHEIAQLGKALTDKDTEIMVIDGDTHPRDRMAMRQRFGSNAPGRMVMITQIGTMSLAVNELVTASHAIFSSLSLQRDEYIQARDRLDRIGQTQPVTFWHVVVPGTVDEVILKAHQQRTNLESAILDHVLGTSTPRS